MVSNKIKPMIECVEKVINRIATIIRNILYLLGLLFVLYSASSFNFFGDWFSSTLTEIGDKFINSKRFSAGHVYYEQTIGDEADDGQLRVFSNKQQPHIDLIEDGEILQVMSKVNLRSTPTAREDKNIIRVLGKNQCVEVLNVSRKLKKGEDYDDADSAIWYSVAEAKCPKQ